MGKRATVRVNAIVVMACNEGEKKVLLIRTRHKRIWGPPKGKVIRGESEAEATRRELYEEGGVLARDGDILGPTHTYIRKREGREEVNVFYALRVSPKQFRPRRAEAKREPTLFSLQEARQRIDADVRRGHRSPKVADEMKRALSLGFEIAGDRSVHRQPLKISDGALRSTIGEMIRERRIHRHLSQKQIAQAVQVSLAEYQRIERGMVGIALMDIIHIGKALDLNPFALIGLAFQETDRNTPDPKEGGVPWFLPQTWAMAR